MQLYTKILLGLVLGTVLGLAGNAARIDWLQAFLISLEPVGTAFIRLITMIVIPLVIASLMVGTASLGDLRKLMEPKAPVTREWHDERHRQLEEMIEREAKAWNKRLIKEETERKADTAKTNDRFQTECQEHRNRIDVLERKTGIP